MICGMYQPRRPSRSENIPVRHQSYHVRLWGRPSADRLPLFMVHGWMDVAASYQFVVDALARERWVIAPDWRGFGHTTGAPVDNYWFPDYLADLDVLIDHYAPGSQVDLVGHSMGGNIAMFYAGVRPQRVRRLVNLEGFGMPATRPDEAPARYAKWIDQVRAVHEDGMALKSYDTHEGVEQRLLKTNPRLSSAKAQWLARQWSAPDAQGRLHILGDPAHKVVNAQLFRVEEALAIYRAIAAPTLAVEAEDDSMGQWWGQRYTLAEYHERIAHVRDLRHAQVPDAGHMLHHDQPEAVARLIEDFL
jgi:pimeloyl-ACP methyl ester carboxylesterase